MNDYDDNSEFEESSTDNSVEEEEDEYYYRRKRGYWDYDDFNCKKCTADDSYAFSAAVKPVIITNVPTLQEMATVSVSVSLWNHVNIPKAVSDVTDRCTKNTKQWKQVRADVLSSIDQLPLPKSFFERIKNTARKMADEITYWVSYHYKKVFLAKGIDNFVYSHVYNIVWYPNARIDYKQTARNMITSLRLTEVEKFKFLCTYCLKEEMEKMSPLLYSNPVLDYVTFANHPLIYYWYCYFRNELHKIDRGSNDTSRLDVDMLQQRNVDNWPALEYFFDRLSAEEQVNQAIGLIDRCGVLYQKAVLMKLNDTQRLSVYMKRALKIITNYTCPRISSKLILFTWFEARHLINEGKFLTLFQLFIREKVDVTVLTDIWTSAPDEFRSFVVNFQDYENVADVLLKWEWRNNSDFIFVFLQDSNISVKKEITRKNFFTDYCENLVKNGQLQRLDRWLEFCLPDPEECLLFKINYLKNSKQLKEKCLKFYSSGDTSGLDDFLNQLITATAFPNFVISYKKDLLLSPEGINKCISVMDSDVEVLNAIIEDSLLDANLVTEFKRNMIFSQSAIAKLRSLLLASNLNAVKLCTDRYLALPEDRLILKKQLLGNLVETLSAILRNNHESYWQTVLLWCCGNEELVQQFKNSLKIDSLFIVMLKSCMFHTFDRYLTKCAFKNCSPSDFHFIDRFLNWYFGSSTEAKEYKLKMVNAYHRIDIFNTLLRGNRGNSQMRSMLKWFLQNDAAAIAKFKTNTCGKFNNFLF